MTKTSHDSPHVFKVSSIDETLPKSKRAMTSTRGETCKKSGRDWAASIHIDEMQREEREKRARGGTGPVFVDPVRTDPYDTRHPSQ